MNAGLAPGRERLALSAPGVIPVRRAETGGRVHLNTEHTYVYKTIRGVFTHGWNPTTALSSPARHPAPSWTIQLSFSTATRYTTCRSHGICGNCDAGDPVTPTTPICLPRNEGGGQALGGQ